jgi:hypothetical protein
LRLNLIPELAPAGWIFNDTLAPVMERGAAQRGGFGEGVLKLCCGSHGSLTSRILPVWPVALSRREPLGVTGSDHPTRNLSD